MSKIKSIETNFVWQQCKGHRPVQKKIVTYLDYQNWVEAQIKKGKKQLRCPICKHWLFQSEWGSVKPNPFKGETLEIKGAI